MHIAARSHPELQELPKPTQNRRIAIVPELAAALEAAGEELIDPEIRDQEIGGVLENPWRQ